MVKSIKKIATTILLSTALHSLSVLSANAAQKFFETEKDIEESIDAGFKKLFVDKNKGLASSCKLSDKGDLATEHFNLPLKREYYMLGDGNCAFRSMGISYSAAHALLLNNSHNPIVRRIAYQEIVDEFTKLPLPMRQTEAYQQLSGSLQEVNLLLQSNAAKMDDPAYDEDFRLELLLEQDAILARIKGWAQQEQVYRDYVTYALTNGHHMLFRNNTVDRVTYFIDAVAYLMNKNLTIWVQYDTRNQNLLTSHSRQATHRLKAVHQFNPVNSTGTLQLIHRGDHFNRIVDVVYPANISMQQAGQDEAASLQALEEILQRKSFTELSADNDYLNFQLYKAILESDDLLEGDKSEARTELALLNAKDISKHEISPQLLKAYCLASLEAYQAYAEKLALSLNVDPDALQRSAQEKLDRIPEGLRGNQNYMRQMQQNYNLSIVKAQEARIKKQQALEELPRIKKWIDVLEIISNKIKLNISNHQILESLNKIIFTLGEKNEALRALQEQDENQGGVNATIQKNTVIKNIYEEIEKKYQRAFIRDLKRRIKAGSDHTKTVIEESLTTTPRIHGLNLRNESQQATNKLVDITNRYIQTKQVYLNPSVITYDPFLEHHNKDINSEYPNDLSWQDMENILSEVKEAIIKILLPIHQREANYRNKIYGQPGRSLIKYRRLEKNNKIFHRKNLIEQPLGLSQEHLLEDFNNLYRIFKQVKDANDDTQEKIATKNILRKRIKRLLDYTLKLTQAEMGEDADPEEVLLNAYAKFAVHIGQNANRCIDGLSDGMERSELQIVYGSSLGEVSLETKISKIIINDRHDFILQHRFFGTGIEEQTTTAELLLQRMRNAMSLRGKTRTIAYPDYGNMHKAQVQPARVMERYLKGERRNNTTFQARTPNYIIDLLYQAQMRNIRKIKGGGEVITPEEINLFVQQDDYMKPFYEDIFTKIIDGEMGVSNIYFEEYNGTVRAKQAFFKYALERLTYIIDLLKNGMPEKSTVNPTLLPNLLPYSRAAAVLFAEKEQAGTTIYQGFNDADKDLILKIATALLTKNKIVRIDEAVMEKAINKVWRKRYQTKLSLMIQDRKQEAPFSLLKPYQEKLILKNAAKLVEEGVMTFENALLKTAVNIFKHCSEQEAYVHSVLPAGFNWEIYRSLHPHYEKHINDRGWNPLGLGLQAYYERIYAYVGREEGHLYLPAGFNWEIYRSLYPKYEEHINEQGWNPLGLGLQDYYERIYAYVGRNEGHRYLPADFNWENYRSLHPHYEKHINDRGWNPKGLDLKDFYERIYAYQGYSAGHKYSK